MGILLRILVMLVLAYAGLCLLLFLRQSHQVFRPGHRESGTPADVGLEYEDVALETRDGETLAAWFVPTAKAPTATVLFCHGNAGNQSDRLGTLHTFHRMGYAILAFDYRGYGRSTGRPTEEGTYRDAEAAWEFLVTDRGLAPDMIVLYGRSLGGAVAANLATRVDTAGLIIESSFSTAPTMAQTMFPYLPARWLCRFAYDTVAAVRRISCPVLVSHSPDDGMIPMSHAEAIYAAAREPRKFVVFRGDHNTGGLDADPGYCAALDAFIAACVRLDGEGDA